MKRKFHFERLLVFLVPIIVVGIGWPLGMFLNTRSSTFWHFTSFSGQVANDIVCGVLFIICSFLTILLTLAAVLCVCKFVGWIYAKD
jgi:hypothetical protein